jgi:RHS repeat-associated protein
MRVLNDNDDTVSQQYWSYATDVLEDRAGVHDSWFVKTNFVHTQQRKVAASGALASGWQDSRETITYDSANRPIRTVMDYDVANPGNVVCTNTVYATSAGDTGAWTLLSVKSTWGAAHYQWQVAEVETREGSCSGPVTGRSQFFYDGATSFDDQHPVDGNVTMERTYWSGTQFTTATATYDGHGRMTQAVSPSQVGSASPAKTRWTYSALGASPRTVTTVSDAPQGIDFVSTLTSEVVFGQPVTLVDTQGRVTQYRYDRTGRLVDGWAPRQSENSLTLTSSHERSVRFNYSSDAVGKQRRTSAARIERVDAPDATQDPSLQRAVTLYNGFGAPFETHTPTLNGETGRLVQVTRYDEHGRVAHATEPFLSSTPYSRTAPAANPEYLGPLQVSYVSTVYDWAGRTVETTRKNNGATLSGTLTRYRDDRTTTIALGEGGVAISARTDDVDRRGRITLAKVHEGWNLTTHTTVGATTATQYAYETDASGGVMHGYSTVTVTDSEGNDTVFVSDRLGRRVILDDPNSGASTYTYNDDGNVTAVASATGTITMEYDLWGRLVQREATPAGSGTPESTTTWRYDTNTAGTVTRPGMLFETAHTTASGTVASTVDQVDAYGAATATTVSLPSTPDLGAFAGSSYTTHVTYDQWGRVESSTQPAFGGLPAETLVTDYDAYGRSAALAAGSADLVTDVGYFATGQTVSRTYGNGMTRHLTWDLQHGRIEQVAAVLPEAGGIAGATVQADTYRYDTAGRVASISDAVAGVRQCYVYDGFNRLSQAWTQQSACEASLPGESTWTTGVTGYASQWTYSPAGRITEAIHSTVVDTPAVTETTVLTYGYGDSAHPAAVTSTDGGASSTYSYDAAGRMISRPDPDGTGSQSLAWDVLSTLTSAGGETYLYDGEGQRVARMMDGAVTVWVGTVEATATTSAGASTADVSASRYYRFAGSVVAVRHVGDVDRDGVDDAGVAFTLGDVQGSAQVTIDAELSATGSVEAASGSAARSTSAYGPYGVTRGSDNLVVSRGWLGQVEDTTTATGVTATGLTYLNARYYDPVLGRFLSPDPLMSPGDPRTLDPYMYAGNNPILYMDANGLRVTCSSSGFGSDESACAATGSSKKDYDLVTGSTSSINTSARRSVESAARSSGTAQRSVGGASSSHRICGTGFACGSAEDEFYGSVAGAGLGGLENWVRGFADSVIGVADLALTVGCSTALGGPFTSSGRGCWSTNSDGGFNLPRIGPSGFAHAEASYFIGSILNPSLLVGGGSGGGARATTTAANVGARSIDDLLRPGGLAIGTAGTDDTIRVITGGLPEAQTMFQQLSQGGSIVSQTQKLTRIEFPDGGGFVQLRTVMSQKSPNTVATIDVNIPGVDITKLKFNP